MKVDRICQNYNNGGHYDRSSLSTSEVIFNSKKLPLGDNIRTNLPNKKSIKFMKKLEWLKGEIGGILITALGTGLVAPFPIAYNPFVKAPKGASEEEIEDVKNTKKYSAMRQPISAVLAILFQVSALKPIDKFLDSIFNNPKYAKYVSICVDQSAINNKSRIEKLAKAKIKKENPSLKGDAYDELLEATKKEIENGQITTVTNKFQKEGKLMVGDRALDNKHLADLVNLQIKDYIEDAGKIKIDNKGLSYYTKRADILIANEARLTEIYKNAPEDKAKASEYIKELVANEKNTDVKMLLEEALQRPVEIQRQRLKRTCDRIRKIKNMCGGEYSYEKYLKALSERNSMLDSLITELDHSKIAKPEAVTSETINATIEKVINILNFDKSDKLKNSVLHDTDTFDYNKEKLTNKVYKDITKQYKEFIRNHYKGLNQIIKIAIGVGITLPITCNVLNWVYPRIMDKWFPELAGSKKAQKAREAK